MGHKLKEMYDEYEENQLDGNVSLINYFIYEYIEDLAIVSFLNMNINNFFESGFQKLIHSEYKDSLVDMNRRNQKELLEYLLNLQDELRNFIINNFINNKTDQALKPDKATIELNKGFNYVFLSEYLSEMGGMKYECLFGNLNLVWDKPNSLRQLLIRDFITLAESQVVLKNIYFCKNDSCKKFVIKRTSDKKKFCSTRCKSSHHEQRRDNKERMETELTTKGYARHKRATQPEPSKK